MSEKNLFQKMMAISEEIKSIEKKLTIGDGRMQYKAVADADVLSEVKKAEIKHGIISIPIKQDLIKTEIVRTASRDGFERITYVDVVKMTLRIFNIDNTQEYIDIESFGRGLDAGDKGFGKASTYARKYALLNAYKIATGIDPDENVSEQQEVLSADEIKTRVMDYLFKNPEFSAKCLQFYNYGDINDFGAKEINSIYKNLTTKGIKL